MVVFEHDRSFSCIRLMAIVSSLYFCQIGYYFGFVKTMLELQVFIIIAIPIDQKELTRNPIQIKL